MEEVLLGCVCLILFVVVLILNGINDYAGKINDKMHDLILEQIKTRSAAERIRIILNKGP